MLSDALEETKAEFKGGHCDAFALALSHECGLPLGLIGKPIPTPEDPDLEMREDAHAVGILDRDRQKIVDVDGPKNLSDVTDDVVFLSAPAEQDIELVETSREDIEDAFSVEGADTEMIEKARRIIRTNPDFYLDRKENVNAPPPQPSLSTVAAYQAFVHDDLPDYDPDDSHDTYAFVQEAYSQGDCRSFALAAAYLLDLSVKDYGIHVGVVDRSGRMYDATGAIDENTIISRYYQNSTELRPAVYTGESVTEALRDWLDIEPDWELETDTAFRMAVGAVTRLDWPLRDRAQEAVLDRILDKSDLLHVADEQTEPAARVRP